jgi:hypothetical protein
MTLDSTNPRRLPVDNLVHSISQSLYGEIHSERLVSAGPPWSDVVAMALSQTGVAPPARLEPYVADARRIRDLIRSVNNWQPGGDAGRVEILVAAWLFMEGLYQASRGGNPANPNQENPQAAQNRQAFQDAINWAFQQVGSNWEMDDLDNTGNHTYGLNGDGRRVRIRSGNSTTIIDMSRDLQDQLRRARTRATELADAVRLDIPGAQPNVANIRTIWRDIRTDARIAAFILYFANQRLHELGYHLERSGNNLLIKSWDTARNTVGDTLHTIN